MAKDWKPMSIRLTASQAKVVSEIIDGALDAGACKGGLSKLESNALSSVFSKLYGAKSTDDDAPSEAPPATNAGDAIPDILLRFVDAFKSGAQGVSMDCDAAQALAEAISSLSPVLGNGIQTKRHNEGVGHALSSNAKSGGAGGDYDARFHENVLDQLNAITPSSAVDDPTRLAVGNLDHFMESIGNPKEPTPALIALLKGSADNRTRRAVPRIAQAMEAKRAELINQPLARIWEDLALAALRSLGEPMGHASIDRWLAEPEVKAALHRRPEIETGRAVGGEFPNEEAPAQPGDAASACPSEGGAV